MLPAPYVRRRLAPGAGVVVFSVVGLRFYPEHGRREDELMAISCFVLALLYGRLRWRSVGEAERDVAVNLDTRAGRCASCSPKRSW